MLNVNNLIGFGVGGSDLPTTATYISTYSSGADSASYTITNANLGTPYAGRRIVIGIACHFSGTATISSITVGGVAATKLVSSFGGGGLTSGVAFYIIEDSSNATANVVLNFSAALAGYAIAIWAMAEMNFTGATTSNAISNNTTSPSLSIPITISKTGVCLAITKGVVTSGITGYTINTAYQVEGTNSFAAGQTTITSPPGATNVVVTSSTSSYLSGAVVFFE